MHSGMQAELEGSETCSFFLLTRKTHASAWRFFFFLPEGGLRHGGSSRAQVAQAGPGCMEGSGRVRRQRVVVV